VIPRSRTARVMNEGCTSMSAAALRKVGSTRCRSVRGIVGAVAMIHTVAAGRNDCNHRTGSNRLVHGDLDDIAAPGPALAESPMGSARSTDRPHVSDRAHRILEATARSWEPGLSPSVRFSAYFSAASASGSLAASHQLSSNLLLFLGGKLVERWATFVAGQHGY
jgi:hypothetical protein